MKEWCVRINDDGSMQAGEEPMEGGEGGGDIKALMQGASGEAPGAAPMGQEEPMDDSGLAPMKDVQAVMQSLQDFLAANAKETPAGNEQAFESGFKGERGMPAGMMGGA
jgi:hypothetical protein